MTTQKKNNKELHSLGESQGQRSKRPHQQLPPLGSFIIKVKDLERKVDQLDRDRLDLWAWVQEITQAMEYNGIILKPLDRAGNDKEQKKLGYY